MASNFDHLDSQVRKSSESANEPMKSFLAQFGFYLVFLSENNETKSKVRNYMKQEFDLEEEYQL